MARILILYCEVMPYNVVAYKALVNSRDDVELDVISWGADKKLTPYAPPFIERVNYYTETDFDLAKLVDLFNKYRYPVIYICNRREKKYLNLALYAKKFGTTIIGQSDEQYYGSLKQFIVKSMSYFLYKRYFQYMVVPGYYQYEFMRYIGFRKSRILIGAYTADIDLFNHFYSINRDRKVPSRFTLLYLGRLEKEKGILQMLQAVDELIKEEKADISVKIIGNGSLLPIINTYPFVTHQPFADQQKILGLLDGISFFILPSHYEPWGVVLHEMAAAGMPLICSVECGARSAVAVNNYNAFVFETRKKDSLKQAIMRAYKLTNQKYGLFSKRSYELSRSVTPETWAETISSFIQ